MMIHEITKQVGKHKARKRIGRGPGSGHGKTSGRGHKGAGSRAGWSRQRSAGMEGGQMPFFRRFPKRGFSNARFAKVFAVVNLRALDDRFEDGNEVNPEMLVKVGLLRDASEPVKILGDGELTKKLNVTAAAFSESAKKKIEAAGGKAEVVEA